MIELQKIQSELKAPKGQLNAYNQSNQFKYRSCEDILEALKPLLDENGCVLTISDDIVHIEGRFYVKATVELKGQTGSVTVSAFARETESKKGFDVAQLTGSASSYARKYALNGLFCIDDTRDPDGQDNAVKMPKRAEVNKELLAIDNLPEYNEYATAFSGKHGDDIWSQPSGNGSNKKETWGQLFNNREKKLKGEPPVDAKTGPEELQGKFTTMLDTADSWATYDFVADMMEKNPALDNQKNIDALLNLEHDLNERLGEK